MSVFIITLLPSKEQILGGVPRYLSISSNIPSTIHYTLDGTTPTVDSPMYTGTITMPVNDLVVVSAFGVDGNGFYSPIITQAFGPFFYGINKGSEGVVVDGPIIPLSQKIIDGYNADDKPYRFLDIPRIDLQLVHSMVGFDGEGLGDANRVLEPSIEQEPGLIESSWQIFTSTEKAQFFNPYAKNIIMDGRKDNEVFFLNRPFGSFRNDKKFDNGKDYRVRGRQGDNYISGGFINHFYDNNKKILVSYYRDSNSLRMVKSIQPYAVNRIGFGNQRFTVPLVFQWIPRGKQATY